MRYQSTLLAGTTSNPSQAWASWLAKTFRRISPSATTSDARAFLDRDSLVDRAVFGGFELGVSQEARRVALTRPQQLRRP